MRGARKGDESTPASKIYDSLVIKASLGKPQGSLFKTAALDINSILSSRRGFFLVCFQAISYDSL